jgi:hypothetical protein
MRIKVYKKKPRGYRGRYGKRAIYRMQGIDVKRVKG